VVKQPNNGKNSEIALGLAFTGGQEGSTKRGFWLLPLPFYRAAVALALALALASCALWNGGATYSYNRVDADGKTCDVKINSSREYAGPVKITFNGCNAKVELPNATNGEAQQQILFDALKILLEKTNDPGKSDSNHSSPVRSEGGFEQI